MLADLHVLPGWYSRLLWSGVAVAAALIVTRLARVIRYVVFVSAAFAVLGIFVRDTLAAIGGVTFVMIVVAFGVEEFGLRTTVIRSLNGDRSYVPNGQIQAASRSPQGYRRYSIELLTSGPARARAAVEAAARRRPEGQARFLRPPFVVSQRGRRRSGCPRTSCRRR